MKSGLVQGGMDGRRTHPTCRNRNTSQRDLLVALAMRLKLIVGEIWSSRVPLKGHSMIQDPGQW